MSESVVEKARRALWPYLDDEDRRKVEAMDAPDQAYFWTLLWYQVRSDLERSALDSLEGAIRKNIRDTGLKPLPESATPFRDAEDMISVHSWFKTAIEVV